MEAEIEAEVAAAADEALESPQPDPSTAMKHLFSEDVDPTSADFDTEDAPQYQADKLLTMVDLLNSTMRTEMERDPRIVVFGEDVADVSRDEHLDDAEGQGRSLQGHPRPAGPLRLGPRVQLPARGGEHRRTRRRAWPRAE